MIDWTVILVALAASLPATLTAVGAFILAFLNRAKIEQIHTSTNSMKDALVKAVRDASYAEGREAGRNEPPKVPASSPPAAPPST